MDISALLPPDLSLFASLLFVCVSFFTAAITAAFGLGGGVALLLIMAVFLPVSALIPVHGVVQLGSNTVRTFVQRKHIVWPIIIAFSMGAVVGAVVGGSVVVALPDAVVKLCVAGFVLYMVWGKVPALPVASYKVFGAGGFVATFLTMFFGATGPFVAAILKPVGLDRHQFVGTHSFAMTVQHGLKIMAFGFLGFEFGAWLPLLCAMLLTGACGTYAGSLLLNRMNEALFRKGFNAIMTALALYIIFQVLSGWL
jgi:uncharacterized membrane protein YfcA